MTDWTPAELEVISAALERADPAAIDNALRLIQPNFPNKEWLPQAHQVRKDVRKAQKKAPHSEELGRAIGEYVAASTPLHLADAWTYFGRALSALAAGSIDTAQHLLYYAELRAMHALLYRHGIAPLSERNSVFTRTGTEDIPFPVGSGHIARNSHQSVWVLFDRWINTQVGQQFCSGLIRLAGVPLSVWVQERPYTKPLVGSMTALLQAWGMDIEQFAKDRQLRNTGTYNPTRLGTELTGVTPEFVADLFNQIWTLLEPTDEEPFRLLDQQIARVALDTLSLEQPSGVAGGHQSEASPDAEDSGAPSVPATPADGAPSADGDDHWDADDRNQSLFDEDDEDYFPVAGFRSAAPEVAANPSSADWASRVVGAETGKLIIEFLDDRNRFPVPAMLASAGTASPEGTLAERFSAMTGRALILLRFATGATRDLLESTGTTAAELEFWITDMLTLHGIRPPAAQQYFDLWLDVSDAMERLTELNGNKNPADMAIITETLARQFQTLSGFERVPAWSAVRPPEESDAEEAVA